MNKYIKNMKKHKYYTISVILLVLLTFSSLTAFTLVEQVKYNKLEREWTIISKYIDKSVDEAHHMNSTNVKYVQRKVNQKYDDNYNSIEQDLKSINTINPLTNILANSIEEDFIFGLDEQHVKDNNDPFYMNWSQILVDLSINCSAEFGVSRTIAQEISMHFNEELAKQSIDDIRDERVDYTVWHYLDVNSELPFYKEVKNLKYVDEQVLRDLFFQYNGDYRVLEGFEFLVPEYIYREVDLAGNPAVVVTGHENENYRLILVQGFNIIDVLEEFEHLDRIKNTKHDIEMLTRRVYQFIGLLTLAWLIGFGVLYKRRKHSR